MFWLFIVTVFVVKIKEVYAEKNAQNKIDVNFKHELKSNGPFERYKAHLVGNGRSQ